MVMVAVGGFGKVVLWICCVGLGGVRGGCDAMALRAVDHLFWNRLLKTASWLGVNTSHEDEVH